jgi:hypothetical protein
MKLFNHAAVPAIALAVGLGLAACASSHPTVKPAPVTYATANQVVQALKAHHVPVTNAVTDSGLSSFQGATSGVWAVTAPGDSTAVFGGSNNPVQDTEIVVFQNHADAVAYVNIGNTTASPDPGHEAILGTNWAVDAATPAAPSIRAVLGGTLVPTASTSAPVAAPTTEAPATVTTTPAVPATLLNFTGHGDESTPKFDTSGDFTVTWSYSGNVDTSFGSSTPTNFIANMNTSGQGEDIAFNGANDVQASGTGNQTVSGDDGTHYFTVQASANSTWTIKVITAS